MKEILKLLKDNPIIAAFTAFGWLISAWLAFYTSQQEPLFRIKEQVIDAEVRAVRAQEQLNSLKNLELDDVENLMQQLVNTYETPAWVKYLDYTNQNFYFLVTNFHYSEVYGTPFIPRGKTDSELYEDVMLEPSERASILEYAVNDRKAIRAGVGKCIQIKEYAYPVNREKPRRYSFKKCMLRHSAQTYVLGYQL